MESKWRMQVREGKEKQLIFLGVELVELVKDEEFWEHLSKEKEIKNHPSYQQVQNLWACWVSALSTHKDVP